MRSSLKPAGIRQRRRAFLLASLLVSGSMIGACASPASSVVTVAPPPRLQTPAWAREPCNLSTLQGSDVADLAVAYRARGVDVRECEGKRALAVQTSDTEHRLEDQQAAARAERALPWWRKLNPWRKRTPPVG